MNTAVVVDAVRTPIGRRNGILRGWHPVDLAATVLASLVDRNGLDPAQIDDVVMGCVMQTGEQSANIARNAVLAAGWPEHIPGSTVDRQGGSGQQAIQFAVQGVMSGLQDVVIAAGVEVMSRVPMGASLADGKYGYPFGPALSTRYEDVGGLRSEGVAAELIAAEWEFGRDELDGVAWRSQQRAHAATMGGRFDTEIVPIVGLNGQMVDADEGVRPTTMDELAVLPPTYTPNGLVSAGNSSQIGDGAAAALIMNERRSMELGLRPLARFVDVVAVGDDPVLMLTAPIRATHRILERTGYQIDDFDLLEVNEGFASTVLAWTRVFDPDPSRLNVNGGAIALGHPLGCSGVRMLATLVHELERMGGHLGFQTMSAGGGMANALVIETMNDHAA